MTDHVYDLVVRAARVVTEGGELPRAIAVTDGRVAAIGDVDTPWPAYAYAEWGADVVLLPGLVDTHVHLQDPGDGWEDFPHGTAAAAAGGITTVVDMPLDGVPVTTSRAALVTKGAAAAGRCHVDVGFWGGLVPGNLAELEPLVAAGALGVKCFLGETGNPDFPPVSVAELEAGMAETARLGVPLLVHAEFPPAAALVDAPVAEEAAAPVAGGPVHAYAEHLAAHPVERETAAVAAVIDGARRTGARVHLAHLSSGDAAALVGAARAAGVQVTAETCPHYLTLAAADIPDEATDHKVCPPIRDHPHRERLWAALRAGVLDLVVSDHSPGPPAVGRATGDFPLDFGLVAGDFAAAFGGIAGLQLSLPLVWTQARDRGCTLVDVARWMATGPAALAGLDHPDPGGGKGRIAVGYDADFCVFAPEETFVVDPAAQLSRHRGTPYAGRRLFGVVRQTWLRGRRVTTGSPYGRLLGRPGSAPGERCASC